MDFHKRHEKDTFKKEDTTMRHETETLKWDIKRKTLKGNIKRTLTRNPLKGRH